MRINRNNGMMETSPCKDQKQGQGQGLDHKDQGKDKDLTHKDQDKDLTHKDQDKTPKDQDKDLKNVLKESLRTRTNIPGFRYYFFDLIFRKYEINKIPKCTPFGMKCSKSRRLLGRRLRRSSDPLVVRGFLPSAIAASRLRQSQLRAFGACNYPDAHVLLRTLASRPRLHLLYFAPPNFQALATRPTPLKKIMN